MTSTTSLLPMNNTCEVEISMECDFIFRSHRPEAAEFAWFGPLSLVILTIGIFLNVTELMAFYKYKDYVRKSSVFHICALTFASTFYCVNVAHWYFWKEILGGGDIVSNGEGAAMVVGYLFGFFGQIVCAVMCSTYGFIAYERYQHICSSKKIHYGVLPHVIIWGGATCIAVLLCFVPFFGRVAIQPSGQYALTDFFQLKSAIVSEAV